MQSRCDSSNGTIRARARVRQTQGFAGKRVRRCAQAAEGRAFPHRQHLSVDHADPDFPRSLPVHCIASARRVGNRERIGRAGPDSNRHTIRTEAPISLANRGTPRVFGHCQNRRGKSIPTRRVIPPPHSSKVKRKRGEIKRGWQCAARVTAPRPKGLPAAFL